MVNEWLAMGSMAQTRHEAEATHHIAGIVPAKAGTHTA